MKGQNTENPSKLIHLVRKVRIVKGVENRVSRTKTHAKITNVEQTAKRAHMQQPAGKQIKEVKERFSLV